MKIDNVSLSRYTEDRSAIEGYAGREVWVVRVHTDEGLEGIAFSTAGISPYGPTGDIAAALVNRNFNALLAGEEPLLIERLWRKMYAAMWRIGRRGLVMQCLGAIDCALWDLKGKLLGVPVSSLLGDRNERVATYVTCMDALESAQLAQKVAGLVKEGHTAVKIRGSATAVSLKVATERVREVRAAIGPDVKLMVDINGTWDADTAVEQLKKWEPYDVYWLEEPVPPEDIHGYVEVRRRAGRTLIAGGEQHATLSEFQQLIERGAADIVQPNANVTGGITEWLRIHAFARAFDVPVSPWNLQLIHLHMAVGLLGVKWLEYFEQRPSDLVVRLFSESRIKEVVEEDGVKLLALELPGRGLVLNEEEAAKAEVKG